VYRTYVVRVICKFAATRSTFGWSESRVGGASEQDGNPGDVSFYDVTRLNFSWLDGVQFGKLLSNLDSTTTMADDDKAEGTAGETIALPTQEKKGSRKNGRAARRRRRKLRGIQEAEDAIREGRTIDLAENRDASVLPQDRSKVWPAVYERRTFHKWNTEDESLLVGQLGYIPGNVINISARADAVSFLTNKGEEQKAPVVVQLYPIVMREEHNGGNCGRRFKSRKRVRHNADDGAAKDEGGEGDESAALIEPFPTMYWLTHPMMRVLVSKLELEGFGLKLEKRLSSEPEAMESMKRAHACYGQERNRLLTDSDRALVHQRNWDAAFVETRGVAGIRNHAAIKCLHAHAAHFLSGGCGSTDNLVGKWVLQEVENNMRKEDIEK
jgi:hypothetical protein